MRGVARRSHCERSRSWSAPIAVRRRPCRGLTSRPSRCNARPARRARRSSPRPARSRTALSAAGRWPRAPRSRSGPQSARPSASSPSAGNLDDVRARRHAGHPAGARAVGVGGDGAPAARRVSAGRRRSSCSFRGGAAGVPRVWRAPRDGGAGGALSPLCDLRVLRHREPARRPPHGGAARSPTPRGALAGRGDDESLASASLARSRRHGWCARVGARLAGAARCAPRGDLNAATKARASSATVRPAREPGPRPA